MPTQDAPTVRTVWAALPLSTRIGIVVTAILSLLALVGGIWSMVMMLATVLLVTTAFGLVFGRRTWLRLPAGRSRAAIGLVTALVVLGVAGGAGGATSSTTSTAEAEPVAGFAAAGTTPASPKATVTKTPTPTPTHTVVVTTETITETQSVAHGSVTVEDGGIDIGSQSVIAGAEGILTRTITVMKNDGVEVSRGVVSEVVTTAPVDEQVRVGTRPLPIVVPAPVAAAPAAGGDCDPNYSGACVPIASDVDCAGGDGNGPAYVSGPVTVIGSDIYDLDRDGDKIACD